MCERCERLEEYNVMFGPVDPGEAIDYLDDSTDEDVQYYQDNLIWRYHG